MNDVFQALGMVLCMVVWAAGLMGLVGFILWFSDRKTKPQDRIWAGQLVLAVLLLVLIGVTWFRQPVVNNSFSLPVDGTGASIQYLCQQSMRQEPGMVIGLGECYPSHETK